MREQGAGPADKKDAEIFHTVSLSQAGAAQTPVITDRKIIRNADLAVEVDSPTEGQHKITAIAEALGGFVVTSEFRQQDRDQTKPKESVIVTVRVPALQFIAALEQVRSIGSRVIQEKVSGQDVTEEYIDLEARLRTQKALEAQFLEIMKQARKVSEALEVQNEIATVRTEIERLEGRRRFLENQSSLSTLNITLQTPTPIVMATTTGFGHDIKQAFGDGVDIAVDIVTGLIRFIIIMTPVAIFILLPFYLLVRFFVRRLNLARRSQPTPEAQQ